MTNILRGCGKLPHCGNSVGGWGGSVGWGCGGTVGEMWWLSCWGCGGAVAKEVVTQLLGMWWLSCWGCGGSVR
jgi:hypothetical protein